MVAHIQNQRRDRRREHSQQHVTYILQLKTQREVIGHHQREQVHCG